MKTMKKIKKPIAIIMSVLFVLITNFNGIVAFAGTGAIWTTDGVHTTVDKNHYMNKQDVFLNGGPQNQNGGSGLPKGDSYYVMVSEPSGTILGDSYIDATSLKLTVDQNGNLPPVTRLWDILRTASSNYVNQGYDTSGNGEYKVEIYTIVDGRKEKYKSDNFQVGDQGTLKIQKIVQKLEGQAVPAGTKFEFTLTGTGSEDVMNPIILEAGQTTDAITLPVGTYIVKETKIPSGFDIFKYTIGSIDTAGKVGDVVQSVNVTISNNTETKVVVTNKMDPPPPPPTGTLKIQKIVEKLSSQTIPTGTKFEFTVTGTGSENVLNPIILEAGQTTDAITLPVGTYTVMETKIPSGFDIVKYAIGSTDTTGKVGDIVQSVNVTISNNTETIVVVTNKMDPPPPPPPTGTLKIQKIVEKLSSQTIPTGTKFEFTVTGTGTGSENVLNPIILEAGQTTDAITLPVGTYTVKETKIPSGFDIVKYTIGEINIDGKTDGVVRSVSVTISNNAETLVVVTNIMDLPPPPPPTGTLKIQKIVEKLSSQTIPVGTKFEFTVTGEGSENVSNPIILEAGQTTDAITLPVGTYTVKETKIPSGFDIVNYTIGETNIAGRTEGVVQSVSVTIRNNTETLVVVTNIMDLPPPPPPTGTLKIQKIVEKLESQTIPAGTKFEFTVSGTGSENVLNPIILEAGQTTDAITLPVGTYTVKETKIPSGFDIVKYTIGETNIVGKTEGVIQSVNVTISNETETKVVVTNKMNPPPPPPTPTIPPPPPPPPTPTPTPVPPTPTPTPVPPTPTPTPVPPTPTPTPEPPTPTVVLPTEAPPAAPPDTPTPVPPTPTSTPVPEVIPTEAPPAAPPVVIPKDVAPGAPIELPKTGGIPSEVFYGFGAGLIVLGTLIRRINK